MNSTKTPRTVREAGDMAEALGMNLSEFLALMAPIPMPPAGYTMAHGSEDRWEGPEIIKRRWIITPVWDMATNLQTVELWMAKPDLAPDDAVQLAADLIAATAGREQR